MIFRVQHLGRWSNRIVPLSAGLGGLLSSSSTSRNTTTTGSGTNRFGFATTLPPPPAQTSASTTAGLSSFIRSATSAIENFGLSSSTAHSNSNPSDPIVELLSQLTGVRRSNTQSTHLQLQQLQAQLTRERESLQQQAAAVAAAASSGAPTASSSSSRPYHHLHHNHAHHHHPFFSTSTSSNQQQQQPPPPISNKLLSSSSKLAVGVVAGANQTTQASSAANLTNALINQILELPSVGFLQTLPLTARDPRYLLSK